MTAMIKQEYTPEFIEACCSRDVLKLPLKRCADPSCSQGDGNDDHLLVWLIGISSVAQRQLDDGNLESMGAWMRDAGKFQGVYGYSDVILLLDLTILPATHE